MITEQKNITCIACPRGCRLELIPGAEGSEAQIRGYECPKGLAYGQREAVEALRILTSTVKTCSAEMPRLPVRLSEPVPLDRFREFMDLINSFLAVEDCKPGDVLVRDFGMPGVNLQATGELHYEN
ncbi:MAG: DUF1667 domain-containing protein [Spirochaetales bacterium]|nr:DUF1667 domain-containing protein [Spirochaetales bacterium]